MAASPGQWQVLLSANHRLPFIIICLCEAIPASASMIYGTILPSTLGDIGGVSFAAWAAQIYAVAGLVGGAAMGRSIDRFGFMPVALVACAAFALGSFLCAIAPNFTYVLLGRIPQGFGAGLIAALGYALVKPLFPEQTWTRLFAALSAVWGVAALSGPALGALFIALGSWRVAFYALAAFGVILAALLGRIAGGKSLRDAAVGADGPPVLRLMALGGASFILASAGIVETNAMRLILALLGSAALIAILRLDAVSTAPFLPRHTFHAAKPLGALFLLAFILAFTTMGWSVYGALMLQVVYGLSPVFAGYGLILGAIGWTVAEIISAHMETKWARAILVLGPLLAIIGLTMVGLGVGHAPLYIIGGGGFLIGASMGVVWPHLSRLALLFAEDEEVTLVAGAIPTLQRLGMAVGAALVGVMGNTAGLSRELTSETMIAASYWMNVGMVPAVVMALLILRYNWAHLYGERDAALA